jgi:hypothetical protein
MRLIIEICLEAAKDEFILRVLTFRMRIELAVQEIVNKLIQRDISVKQPFIGSLSCRALLKRCKEFNDGLHSWYLFR